MGCAKSPEDEVNEFLATQPSWLQKFLQLDFSLSREELSAWQQSEWWWKDTEGKVENEYLRLLQRCPAKWREYRERKKKLALRDVPPARRGRPETPLNELTDLLALKEQGLNQKRIAKRLTLTREAVRKRLKAAEKRMPREKP